MAYVLRQTVCSGGGAQAAQLVVQADNWSRFAILGNHELGVVGSTGWLGLSAFHPHWVMSVGRAVRSSRACLQTYEGAGPAAGVRR